jgi:hypothetical protein
MKPCQHVAPSNAQALQRSGPGEVVKPSAGVVKPKKGLVIKWAADEQVDVVGEGTDDSGKKAWIEKGSMIWKQLAGMKLLLHDEQRGRVLYSIRCSERLRGWWCELSGTRRKAK